jgi:hypothetical protein
MKCFDCSSTAHHQHHVVPKSRGGTRTVPLCAKCHGLVHDIKMVSLSQLVREGIKKSIAEGRYRKNYPVPRVTFTSHTARLAGKKGIAARAAKKKEFEKKFKKLIKPLVEIGLNNRMVADVLNSQGYKTLLGKSFTRTQVWRLNNE